MLKRLFTVRNLIILLAIVGTVRRFGRAGFERPRPGRVACCRAGFPHWTLRVTNSLFLAWIVMIVLVVLALLATRRIPKDMSKASNADLVPSGIQNVFEMLVEALYNLTRSVAGSWTPKFFPIVATIFLFVLFANYSWPAALCRLGGLARAPPR